METNTTGLFRDMQEFCGIYNSTPLVEGERFTLKVVNELVPVFLVTDETFPAQYPEIRIVPITDVPITKTERYEKEKGTAPFEDPNVDYVKKREDTTVRNIEIQIDIFTKDFIFLTKIRDKMVERIDGIFQPEVTEFFTDPSDWVGDTEENPTVFINAGFTSEDDARIDNGDIKSTKIARIYEGDKLLTKVESLTEVQETEDSWLLNDDNGLVVNSAVDITDLKFIGIINGFVFSDGFSAQDKGYTAYKVMMSRILPDEDPEVQRWIFEIMFTFKEVKEKNVGESFGVVNVYGETD